MARLVKETRRVRRLPPAVFLLLLVGAVAAGYPLGIVVARPAPAPAEPPAGVSLDAGLRRRIDEGLARARRERRDAAAHGDLGLLYEANELWDAAAASYRNAAIVDPGDARWRHRMAVVCAAQGNFAGALALADDAARLAPELASAHHQRGTLLLELSQLDAAEAAFRRVTLLRADAAEGWLGLGEVLLRRALYADAAAALEEALARDQSYAAARHALGTAYRGLGRDREATRELSLGEGGRPRALAGPLAERLPALVTGVPGRVKIAGGLIAAGRPADAITYLEGALREHPDDVALRSTLGRAQVASGDLGAAEVSFKRALQQDDRHAPSCINLSELLLLTRNLAQADPVSQHAIAIAPASGAAHRVRGRVLAALGRADDAIQALELAVLVDPADPLCHLELARVLLPAGERTAGATPGALRDRARGHVDTAGELAPFDARVQTTRAELLFALGDQGAALAACEAAEEAAPGQPALAELRARILEAGR